MIAAQWELEAVTDQEPVVPSQPSVPPYAPVINSSTMKRGGAYVCQICDFSCDSAQVLSAHTTTHLALFTHNSQFMSPLPKPFRCTKCEFSATERKSLIEHEKTHQVEKPYSCTMCSYVAKEKWYVARHMLSHDPNKAKPHKCDQCDYKTSQKGHLIRHIKTHTGEKPYQCSECSYRGSRKSHLERHYRTHTGERPYSCPQCEYSAARKSNLDKHMKVHARKRERQQEEAQEHNVYTANASMIHPGHMPPHIAVIQVPIPHPIMPHHPQVQVVPSQMHPLDHEPPTNRPRRNEDIPPSPIPAPPVVTN